MNTNQIDISGNIVRIPIASIIEVTEIATGKSRVGVERNLSEIQEIFAYKYGQYGRSGEQTSLLGAKRAAEYLVLAAKDLSKSINLLHALQESKTREELEIVRS